MDRALVEQHLAQAEGHVTLGQQHITRQQEIILELENKGHDTSEARRLLAQFEELQAIHVADRDRLWNKLAQEAE